MKLLIMRRAGLALLAAAMLAGANSGVSAQQSKKSSGLLPGSNSKEPVNIEAQKLDYFDRDQKLVYTGNVVAVQGASTLKCSVLVIYLEKRETTPAAGEAQGAKPAQQPAAAADSGATGSGRVKRMEAAGPVTITSKDQVGTGDRGVYDKGENKVYLYDNVTLSEGTNVTKGDKLIYDMNTTQAVVYSSQATGGRVRSVFTPSNDDKAGKKDKPEKAADKPKSKPAAEPKANAGN